MNKIFFNCICGKKYNLLSSYTKNIEINICKNCHPFFTKKKSSIFSKKINNFNKKYEKFFN